MAPFYGWGSTASGLQSHIKEAVYSLPITGRHYFLYKVIVMERFGATAMLRSSLKQMF